MMQRFWKWAAKRAAKFGGLPLRDPALKAMFGSEPASSGIDVTEDTALNCSAVFAAVRLISQSIASLPIGVVQKSGSVRKALPDHPYNAIFESPNPEMIPFVFVETLMAHALTWGNGYARIDRSRGLPTLWPMLPSQVTPKRDESGELYYDFHALYPGEQAERLAPADVIHIVGLGFDGLKGYSVIDRAREAVGLALAAENFGGSFFGRGAMPGGIIKHPGELEKTAEENLRQSWERMHKGPGNAHRVAILDEGMGYEALGIPQKDAQFLETRQFQVIEIARWFNLPPYMLRDLAGATFSNIEHQGLEFLSYTLLPWLLKWQQELRRKLFTPEEQRAGLLVDHDVSVFLKTDTATRYQTYATGMQGGWLTLNNILQKENLPPLASPIGDARAFPENMRLFDAAGNEIQRTKASDDAKGSVAAIQVLASVAQGLMTPAAAKLFLKEMFGELPPEQLDAIIGKPNPTAVPPNTLDKEPNAPAVASDIGVDAAADTALNGAQIASLLTIIQSVAAGTLSPESALPLIQVSFPRVPVVEVEEMLAPYQNVPQVTPPVAPDHEGRGVLSGVAIVASKLASAIGVPSDKVYSLAFKFAEQHPIWTVDQIIAAVREALERDEFPEGRALRVPDVHQTDDSSCGLACLRSVLAFYGVDEQQGATHPDGLKPSEIADLARTHGLDVLAGPMGLPGLRRQLGMGRPVICPIQVGNPDGTQSGHYVVVRGFAGASVQLQDPAYGPVVMAREAFLERWHDVDRDGEEYNQYGIAIWR